MRALGRAIVAHPWRTVAVWVAVVVVLGALGGGLQDRLANRGYEVPGSQSERAEDEERAFAGGDRTRLFVALAAERPSQRGLRRAGAEVGARVRGLDDLDRVEPAMRGRDGRAAVVPVVLRVDVAEAQKRVDDLRDRVEPLSGGGLDVGVIGQAAVLDSYSTIAEEDLSKAEQIAFPATLALLVVAFLSLVAAAVPLGLALVGLTATFGVLYLLSLGTDMSVFVTNTALLLGVGLSIDYSLFMVTRYREELGRGADVDTAIIEALRTSGRTVVASAVTVAASLVCLTAVGVGIFSSMTYGGSAAALMAGAGAVTLVPAVLRLLGPRIDRFSLRRAVRAAQGARLWRAIGELVIRRRVAVVVAVAGLLVAMTLPVLWLEIDVKATSALPTSDPVRSLSDRVGDSLGAGAIAPLEIYTRGEPAAVRRIAAATPGIAAVGPAERGSGGRARVLAQVADAPDSDRAEATVTRLRARLAAAGAAAVVGGQTALGLDLKDRIESRTPAVILVALLLGGALLVASLRSIVVPIKALLTTLLSAGAALGAITLAYDLFGGDTQTMGYFVPLFLFAIVFGLSVDYELFLLSRIREDYDARRDNDAAIRSGLVRSARPITLAALVMVSVFLAFAASSLVPLQQIGFGLALAVLIDATLIRALLVPAALSLLGDRNWWFPIRAAAPQRIRA